MDKKCDFAPVCHANSFQILNLQSIKLNLQIVSLSSPFQMQLWEKQIYPSPTFQFYL